jgi:hypothetical protein
LAARIVSRELTDDLKMRSLGDRAIECLCINGRSR